MSPSKSQPSLVIYRGFPERDTYVWSPFVTKLEAQLRFAGASYTYETGSTRLAPRGKIPYIALKHDGGEPELLGDSQLISERLVREGVLSKLNESLSPVENTLDMGIKALLEDKLYFYNTHERWNENYYTMRDKILAALPYPIRAAVGIMIWRNINAGLYGQGTGRFTPDEIHTFRDRIWDNIENLLADARRKAGVKSGPFWIFGGDQPAECDFSVFAFTIGCLICKAGPESAKKVRSLPSVIDYARRIHEQYFSDYTGPEWE
ncbi:putative glutathione S-transferase [Talaromyces proteolyticus]|uniref:Glutathione S-transferase n=1 Tax=Talaromyces proteolyticus TaxID=1131652 RepID=A0AAD4PYP7_9EURO|nr:putative glutathione S-transferase [Talaromyces proteolyticus]KAH8701750.1 putative glutathione S-transferase [Talaromyces proteolyticus]